MAASKSLFLLAGHTGEKDGYFIPVEGVDGPVGHAVANRGRAA